MTRAPIPDWVPDFNSDEDFQRWKDECERLAAEAAGDETMSETPICPVHSTPMRAGKGGAFFCPKKKADGTWCDQRIAAPKAEGGAAPAVTIAAPASTGEPLAAAALWTEARSRRA